MPSAFFLAVFFLLATSIIAVATYKKPYSYKQVESILAMKTKTTWHDSFATITTKWAKGGIYDDLIKRSGKQTTTERILTEQIILPIIMIVGSGIVTLITGLHFFFIAGILLAGLFIYAPIANLKSAEKKRKELIRKEAPNFVLTVRLLLKGKKTPVDALKLACQYGSGKGMQAYTDELYENLDIMQPESALSKFANDTGVVEIMEFALLFGEYMRIGATKDGEDILKQLETTFRDLEGKLMDREKEIRPKKLRMVNYGLGINAIAFIITAVILYLMALLGTSKL